MFKRNPRIVGKGNNTPRRDTSNKGRGQLLPYPPDIKPAVDMVSKLRTSEQKALLASRLPTRSSGRRTNATKVRVALTRMLRRSSWLSRNVSHFERS